MVDSLESDPSKAKNRSPSAPGVGKGGSSAPSNGGGIGTFFKKPRKVADAEKENPRAVKQRSGRSAGEGASARSAESTHAVPGGRRHATSEPQQRRVSPRRQRGAEDSARTVVNLLSPDDSASGADGGASRGKSGGTAAYVI